MTDSANTAAVRRFYETFNSEDLDGFVAVLISVEMQTARGLLEGREEARAWARRNPAGWLHQRLVLERVLEDERRVHAVALIRKQWWWRESNQVARDDPEAALFTFRDGLICRWQPFESRAEALAAAGLD